MWLSRVHWIRRLIGIIREIGPYAAIELVLPGGSLIALGLWALQHRKRDVQQLRSTPVYVHADGEKTRDACGAVAR